MTPASSPLRASRTASTRVSMSLRSSSEILSPRSFTSRSAWKVSASASLRESASRRRLASSSACSAASRTILSTSSLESIDEAVMVTFCSLLVALSLAVTLRIPLASMSKVTSIWGTPRGAGGMPSSRNVASFLLSAAISRSPCRTTMSTDGWLSLAVEKIWVWLVGMVVLRPIIRVATPASVSIPSEGDEVLQLGAGERHDQVLGARGVRRDKRQVDLGAGRAGELDLRLLGGLLEALQGDAILRQVDALVLLELLAQPLDHALVEVIAAQVRVTVGGSDLEDALRELQDGDVKGPAAQVV